MIVSPDVVVHAGRHLHGGRVLLVEDTMQREGEAITVIPQCVAPLTVG